ncbi:unnamed protein product, partial [Sphacelaria rigidula]
MDGGGGREVKPHFGSTLVCPAGSWGDGFYPPVTKNFKSFCGRGEFFVSTCRRRRVVVLGAAAIREDGCCRGLRMCCAPCRSMESCEEFGAYRTKGIPVWPTESRTWVVGSGYEAPRIAWFSCPPWRGVRRADLFLSSFSA